MKVDNFENDFYHAINNPGIGDCGLLSDFWYIDMDNTWEHPIMKLVLAITNYKKNPNNAYINTPIFIYINYECIVSLNNWENPKFFTTSFLTLFSFRIRGYIFTTHNQKKEKILLEV